VTVSDRPIAGIPESFELDFYRVRYPLGSSPSEFEPDSDIGQNSYVSH